MDWFKSDTQKLRERRDAILAQQPDIGPFILSVLERLNVPPNHPTFGPVIFLIVTGEALFAPFPDVPDEYFLNRKERALSRIDEYRDALVGLFRQLQFSLSPSPFHTTVDALTDRDNVQHIFDCVLVSKDLFPALYAQLLRNRKMLSKNPDKPIRADEYDGPTHYLLAETPFLHHFEHQAPVSLGDRFSHMHVLGGTGAGKTTLIETLILADLERENPPSLVIVDSQADLIRTVSRLAMLRDRNVVLVSPKDTKHPPAINIFDVNQDRLGTYDDATKEQVIAGVIETFDYLFSGLIGADLTAKQDVFFKNVARLMLSLPNSGILENSALVKRNATILDMIALMEDPTPYLPAIQAMPTQARRFLEKALLANNKGQTNKTFSQTKEQIGYRLHAVIENPTLERLFTSPKTKLDLFTALNTPGTVILVDTAKDFLKETGSANFGRIFISLVLQAILERAAIPDSKRHPVFLYVDEAAEYFDQNIDHLLTETRKYRCGCVFAHQYLDQCTGSLRASLAANTAIKFAGGVSMSDARSMAPDMHTTPDFILSQSRLHFAAHVKYVTSNAVSVPVEPGRLDRFPKLSDAEFEAFLERNRARVSYRPETPPGVSPTEDEDVSDRW